MTIAYKDMHTRPVSDHAPSEYKSQVAALCVRQRDDETQILLITSRDTGRWIIPKGWPMKGKTDLESALQEAWEEAGVHSDAANATPIGTYSYDKTYKSGRFDPIEVDVYRVEVADLSSTFPEVDERRRKWMAPEEAADLVEEPELQELLRTV